MIYRIYYKIHRFFSGSDGKGEYSGGRWQEKVRSAALEIVSIETGRVLELGCGEGLFLARLASERPGLEVWGIDNSRERIASADARLKNKGIVNAHVRVADAVKTGFDDGYFDSAICINVLFNLPSFDVVRGVMLEMARLCKKGGTAVFDFRNAANPILPMKYALAKYYDKTVTDLPLKLYRYDDIEKLAGECGFEIKSKRYVGFPGNGISPIVLLEAVKC